MCWWTNKLLLRSMQGILLLASMLCFILAESASNEFTPLAGDACPGDVLTYTCTIIGGGSTIWSGSAFDCSSKSNEIILRHSQFASGMDGNCNGGAITARSLGVVDDTCYSSQLNLTFNSDLNNKTVQCAYSSETIESIGVATLSIATAPPPVRLAEIRPGELIFDWRPSINRLTSVSYNISTTCGTCPIMTNATMVTCSDLSLSTTLTMCTFSVRSVACGTIGTPSIPVVVTLGVPDIPNVKVIPQYDNELQSLTGIIVRVEQNVTSFPITDTISGSTTSYSIIYGSKMQNKTVCTEDNYCEYTVDIPPSFCSTSSVVNVTVVAANLLGFGRPMEPIILECTNQFVRVNYDPANTVLSCTFLNKSDSSPKSCSVIYGTCGQEIHTIQGSGIDGSPSMITIKLNSSIINSMSCYIVTASNGTYEIVVNGSINLPTSEKTGNALLSLIVLPAVFLLGMGGIIIIVIGVLFWRRRQQHDGERSPANVEAVQGHELEELKEREELEELLSQYKNLYPINSNHFTESTLASRCTLKQFRRQKGLERNDLIFLEYTEFKRTGAKIRDVILRYKNGKLYAGPDARNMVNNEEDLSKWKDVFVSPRSGITQNLTEEAHVLHQNPLEKSIRFKVLVVEENSTLTDFMSRKKCYPFETEQIFYEFLPTDKGFSLLHYVEVATIEDSKQLNDESIVSLDSGIHYFYTVLKAPGENIKHPGRGRRRRRVFIQGTANSLKRMYLTAGSLILYKVIDKAGLTADDHAAI